MDREKEKGYISVYELSKNVFLNFRPLTLVFKQVLREISVSKIFLTPSYIRHCFNILTAQLSEFVRN